MKAFLLTRQWRDTRSGVVLDLWLAGEQGPVQVEITGQQAVFFVCTDDLPRIRPLLNQRLGTGVSEGDAKLYNIYHQPVTPLYFNAYRAARDASDFLRNAGIPHWEADIRPPERYLMERFITGAVTVTGTPQRGCYRNPQLRSTDFRPVLKIVSLDIETTMDAKQLYSIAVYGEQLAKVFMVGPVAANTAAPRNLDIIACRDQAHCLSEFLQWLADYDPDILLGWNLVQFDLWVLENLCQASQVKFTLGRNRQTGHWREDKDSNRRYLQIPGRVALDGIDLLKAAFYSFTSYALENVAQQLLGTGKLNESQQRGDEITHWFHEDKQQLARYNLNDCELVWDIFQQESLIEFALARSQLTGMALDRMGGSVASFDYAYLPLLHRKGYVAPNLGELVSELQSPGGYVLDSRPGIFRNVLVLDFKSLYPSIIRTFRIDPYGFWAAQHQPLTAAELVPGFHGAQFAKNDSLLPGIIERLWQARDQAKRENNAPLSQAIKIIMNSFYGVLGSTGCRFYDPRVCSSITLRGHEIIHTTKQWIEAAGYEVIYGDTDSVFVWVGDDKDETAAVTIGQTLAKQLNHQWRAQLQERFAIDSALELEFETHYKQFLMPTIRNSTEGSKKRYAGIVASKQGDRLVFKGLENVRTDWTVLAKQFQETLYQQVFAGRSVEALVQGVVEDVLAGERDDQLIYSKRLRRRLHEYQKNIPPHVQAARRLQQWTGQTLNKGEWIEYVITTQGPEPVQQRQSPLDYQHYIDRQLAPVADGVLQFVGLRFAEIVAPQMNLFG